MRGGFLGVSVVGDGAVGVRGRGGRNGDGKMRGDERVQFWWEVEQAHCRCLRVS